MFVSSGGEHIHFDSSQFSANLSGLHSDLTYNLNSWVGLEGNVISSGGGEINHERTKYVLHAGGAHLGWGNTRKCFSPWSHVLVGGVHLNPQVARSIRASRSAAKSITSAPSSIPVKITSRSALVP
jgi:hypothetical protein